jgi:hypothetical protein
MQKILGLLCIACSITTINASANVEIREITPYNDIILSSAIYELADEDNSIASIIRWYYEPSKFDEDNDKILRDNWKIVEIKSYVNNIRNECQDKGSIEWSAIQGQGVNNQHAGGESAYKQSYLEMCLTEILGDESASHMIANEENADEWDLDLLKKVQLPDFFISEMWDWDWIEVITNKVGKEGTLFCKAKLKNGDTVVYQKKISSPSDTINITPLNNSIYYLFLSENYEVVSWELWHKSDWEEVCKTYRTGGNSRGMMALSPVLRWGNSDYADGENIQLKWEDNGKAIRLNYQTLVTDFYTLIAHYACGDMVIADIPIVTTIRDTMKLKLGKTVKIPFYPAKDVSILSIHDDNHQYYTNVVYKEQENTFSVDDCSFEKEGRTYTVPNCVAITTYSMNNIYGTMYYNAWPMKILHVIDEEDEEPEYTISNKVKIHGELFIYRNHDEPIIYDIKTAPKTVITNLTCELKQFAVIRNMGYHRI